MHGTEKPLRRAILGIVAVGLLFAAPHFVGAQVVVVEGPAICDECRIEVELATRLGDIREPASPMAESRVALDASNVFYVGPSDRRGSILTYDADGSLLGSLGGLGQGPRSSPGSRTSRVTATRCTSSMRGMVGTAY